MRLWDRLGNCIGVCSCVVFLCCGGGLLMLLLALTESDELGPRSSQRDYPLQP